MRLIRERRGVVGKGREGKGTVGVGRSRGGGEREEARRDEARIFDGATTEKESTRDEGDARRRRGSWVTRDATITVDEDVRSWVFARSV